MALVFYDVYEVEDGFVQGAPHATTPVFRHAFTQDPITGDAALGAGSPIGPADIAELVSVLQDQRAAEGLQWHPERLLASGAEKLVWYTPPAVRRMWFEVSGEGRVQVTAPWPGLVFVAQPNGLAVAAYKGDGRPEPDAPLFHAPLANVYANGSVCLGSAAPPQSLSPQELAAWESLVFETAFSHPNHRGTLLLDEMDAPVDFARHVAFWLGLDGQSVFPEAVLRPFNQTLAAFAEH